MRQYPDPDDQDEQEELVRLNAEPWMLELLKLNPEYTCWGPHEDYMGDRDCGWREPVFCKNWQEFDGELNKWNECVHFYFEIERKSVPCPDCERSGYNPETKQISDDFYDFNDTGRRWCDHVTQDEVDALVEAYRLRRWDHEKHVWVKVPRTAEEVNQANRDGAGLGSELGHDSINKWILVETRAKRLGVWGKCPRCGGHGDLYVEPAAHVNLVLWLLHPRKGASRGIEIKNIRQQDLPSVMSYLTEAANRNARRFCGIIEPTQEVLELLIKVASQKKEA
jgi:hypothetical protein